MSGVTINDRVNVSVGLQTQVAIAADLKKTCYFVDSPEIPVDRRFLDVTGSDFEDLLDEAGSPYAFAALHFMQENLQGSRPQALQIARWAQAASKPYFTMEDFSQVVADYTGITTGTLRVALATDNETYDDVTGINLSSIDSVADLVTALNAKLAAFTPTNITGLDSAIFSVDVYSRLILTMPGTGAAAVNVEILDDSGDLAGALGVASGFATAGLNAETIGAAIDALRAANDTAYYYAAKFSTASDEARSAEILAFAAKVQTLEKFGMATTSDTGCKNSASTTDIAYQLKALGYNRTSLVYYEDIASRATMIPEAAELGYICPLPEGSNQFDHRALIGVTGSGFSRPLTYGETEALKAKNCNVIETVSGTTYLYPGVQCNGVESRLIPGRDYFIGLIRSDIFTNSINQEIMAFDQETLDMVGAVVQEAFDVMGPKGRRVLVDTKENPFVITIPDADSFTSAQRATRKMELLDFFSGKINTSVADWTISGTWYI